MRKITTIALGLTIILAGCTSVTEVSTDTVETNDQAVCETTLNKH